MSTVMMVLKFCSSKIGIVLYNVVISLVTPFFLFKYLDHLPQLKMPSKSLKNNEEKASFCYNYSFPHDFARLILIDGICPAFYMVQTLKALFCSILFLLMWQNL